MRTFIALELPESIRKSLWEASDEIAGEGIKLVWPNEMHITLQFLGELSEETVGKVKDAIGIAKGYGSFEISVMGVNVFTPRYIRVVFAGIGKGSEKVVALYGMLSAAFRDIAPAEEANFVPHITLARVKHLKDRGIIDGFLDKYKSHVFGEFTASSIKLKSSILTGKGPIYSDLCEIKL